MRPTWPGSPTEWRERARAFAEAKVRPRAEEIDRTDRLPPELVDELAGARFLGLGIPERYGGVGGDTRSTVAVLEELARGSAAVAVLLSVHLSVCAAPILRWGTDGQKERYLPPLARGELRGAFALTEPGVGSDTARLATRYSADGNGFVLTGTKMFTSNAVDSGLFLVFATRDPSLGSKAISAFVVPPGTPGFSVAQRLDKLGLHGSETNELVFEAARLAPDAMLGPEGRGLTVALEALTGGRVGIASCALGVAQAAFELLLDAVRSDDADWKRGLLARAYAEVAAARALVTEAASRRDAGQEFVDAASAAKLVASRAAFAVASAGVDVAGYAGVRSGSAAERLLRDARVFPIVEGTSEIQERILARRLLDGRAPPNV